MPQGNTIRSLLAAAIVTLTAAGAHAETFPMLTALEKMGAAAVGSSPAEFDAFMRAEAVKWEPVLKEANIKVQ